MKIYSNVTDPGKKKKITKTTVKKVGSAPKKESGVEMTFERGKTTREYTPADVRTGDKRYGPESKTKPTPAFVKEAQAKKKDIVMKGGKPYRAGYTEVKEDAPKFSSKIKVTPDVRPVKTTTTTVTKEKKASGKSGSKLKPMAMTYGTDSPTKGGGTKYKKKVRSLMKR
jgi:hypothetical protein